MKAYSGQNQLKSGDSPISGEYKTIDGEKFYLISNYDGMQPFFLSLSSDSDVWTYVSTSGGITAGRRSPDRALFPYYTDDKVTDGGVNTGSKTIIRLKKGDSLCIWEPFCDRQEGAWDIIRSVAKSVTGNKLIFIEENRSLGLRFSYMYANADAFGLIKESRLENIGTEAAEVELLDGLQNLLPDGVTYLTQARLSCLVDAYKKSEMVEGLPLALFRMESLLADHAEPSESLSANAVWFEGLEPKACLVSSRQLATFRRGQSIENEPESKGVRGALLVVSEMRLAPGEAKTWHFAADVAQDAAKIHALIYYLRSDRDKAADIKAEIGHCTETLRDIVSRVDGVQATADEADDARHFANSMYNAMRGGLYCDAYNIKAANFRRHVELFNKPLAERMADALNSLPEQITYSELIKTAEAAGSKQLLRLAYEYLPLTFSRRHGDPSRPWNLFDIRVNDDKGERIISYQGNWRDIFQNWEALSLSYPGYLPGIIAKFLNATTADGYNPYKIGSEGIDWEVIIPADPWSNIGYWGDHQIIYLLKLLELSEKYYPGGLEKYFNRRMYAFANVPYRFKSYDEIVADPKNSIRFDDDSHRRSMEDTLTYGRDARLMRDSSDRVVLASFTEKILASYLAKLSNFVPEAGIWMNTLRPEWNDANNALVGNGASMVTLYYMRRYAAFMLKLFSKATDSEFEMSAEMYGFFNDMLRVLNHFAPKAAEGFDDAERRSFANHAGYAAEKYREKVYGGFSGNKGSISRDELCELFRLSLSFFDASIERNRRDDGMYHAYNTIEFYDGGIRISRLYEMLEGQVAVLSALKLTPAEAAGLLKALRSSSLYRADQNSYVLYPAKRLPRFLDKNNIPEGAVSTEMADKFTSAGVLTRDCDGGLHFASGMLNDRLLAEALEKAGADEAESSALRSLYEQVFNHRQFTGRSGTFYKYEGLGCIYWHMVSKLLLAVGENIQKAEAEGASAEDVEALKAAYRDIRDGIGAHKAPNAYGAFPFDAYSHTPSMAGAQQPGMTGQVKEDIIDRFFELGVRVEGGAVYFGEGMLRDKDFVNGPDGASLEFTLCGCPVRYVRNGKRGIEVALSRGEHVHFLSEPLCLKPELSEHLFGRDSYIESIEVCI